MNDATWRRLDDVFREHPVLNAGSVPDERELDQALGSVGLPTAATSDFREFVSRYGGAIVGALPVIGLRAAPVMAKGEGSFVETTKRFREGGWLGVDRWLVFSIDHSGNPFGLDDEGRVLLSEHDEGEVLIVAMDFESFLLERCLED